MEMVQQVVRDQDEIDLFDLVDDIRDKWRWLAGFLSAGLLLALVYAFVAAPVYQTEVVYKDVTDAELLPLNQPLLRDPLGVADGQEYLSIERAFKEVRAKALSSNSMRTFYSELLKTADPQLKALIYKDSLTEEQNLSQFIARFSHKDPGAKDTDMSLSLTFELGNPLLASDVLNAYSDFVLSAYKAEKQAAVTMQVAARLDQWKVDAEQKRASYKAGKSRTLLELKEAAAVAASINQQQPLYSGDRVMVGQNPPLYMMGERALRAQIREIEARPLDNEDAYIPGLPELLWKIGKVENASVNWDQVRFVEVDQAAVVPLKPLKPKKTLMVALGTVAGLMAGVMAALLAAARSRRAMRKAAEQAN